MNKLTYLRKIFAEKFNSKEYNEAVQIGESILREHKNNQVLVSPNVTSDIYNLACAHHENGNHRLAIHFYYDSVLRTMHEGGETKDYAKRVTNLATALAEVHMYPQAYQAQNQAIQTYKNKMLTHTRFYADAMYNLAKITENFDENEALDLHMTALKLNEKIAEKTGVTTAVVDSLYSIANLHEDIEDFDKAIPYAKAALDMVEDDTKLSAMTYLASLYEQEEMFEEAVAILSEVQSMVKKETINLSYFNVTFNCGVLLLKLKEYTGALSYFTEISTIFDSLDNEYHVMHADSLRNMALIHSKIGEINTAELLILKAMKIRRKIGDITADIICFMHILLTAGEVEKTLDLLIYALMRLDSDFCNYDKMIDDAMNELVAHGPPIEELVEQINALNDKSRLSAIISKWTSWESED